MGRDSQVTVFDPPGVSWTPVSPALASLWRVVLGAVCAVLAVVVAVAASLSGQALLWALLAGPPVLLAVGWRLTMQQVQAWGYAEREDDLLLRRGVIFRQLTVVPYGRMQFVDVQAGPLERAFSLASVQLHTASAETDARIPGLPPEEAARLRDRLASRGTAGLAGL